MAFPRRRVKVQESRRATNMWAQSGAGHKTRETMLKRKQSVHSRRITNWLTLCYPVVFHFNGFPWTRAGIA